MGGLTCPRARSGNLRHDKSKNPVKKRFRLNYQAIDTCLILSHIVGMDEVPPRQGGLSTVKVTSCYIFTWTLYTLIFDLYLYKIHHGIGLVFDYQAFDLIHYCTLQAEKNTLLRQYITQFFAQNLLIILLPMFYLHGHNFTPYHSHKDLRGTQQP